VGVFRRIEAVGYRCLREVNQELNPFEILVGPNGSGKSAFLDVIHFLGDVVRHGADVAVRQRTPTFQDLVWCRSGNTLRFAVDAANPNGDRESSYDLSIALDRESGMILVKDESATLPDNRRVTVRTSGLSVRSSLGEGIPELAWLRWALADVRVIRLDPKALVEPSPPERESDMVNTGASLAWQIRRLQEQHPEKLDAWLAHVRTALPDVCKIESTLQPWDNRRFVRIQYENGLQVPSWMLSEGTLRLLALTILAYLPDFHGVYMVEEPENGVHPAALETIYQSLSSVYNAQVLVATHSPVLLSMARPGQILCFSKTREGTTITRGNEHPALKEWQGEVSLGTMVASGILS
jgi:predicted ATPase